MVQAVHPSARYTRHFHSLDVLRGLAALSIVFYHWHQFFGYGAHSAPFDESRQPYFSFFKPLYTDGWRAVSLFFSLSGFIFYWLYSERIKEKKISCKEFFVLRFSRLYPLHFVTLLFVAVGQAIMIHAFGSYFCFKYNDVYHFTLQLFFISNWGFERGLSFNGPIWSVSVEVFLYILFFITCFFSLNRWWYLLLLACSSLVLSLLGLQWLSRGVVAFFIGGMAYRIFLYLWSRGLNRYHVFALIGVTALLWILIPLNMNTHAVYNAYRSCFLQQMLKIHDKDVVGASLLMLTENACELVLFPLTVLTFAVGEAYRGTLGKRLAFLGNISYSAYLTQFPLQLVFMLFVLAFSLPDSVLYSPWVMLGFFGILFLLSLSSYHFLERPAQKFLRTRLL